MNNDYLSRAKKMIPDPQILSVVTAKRAKQLALGGVRPMVKCDSENYLDVALLEIAEGLLSYEFGKPGEPVVEKVSADSSADPVGDGRLDVSEDAVAEEKL